MKDIWNKTLSAASKNSRPSPVREILKVLGRPGMISFAGGIPAPEVFPVDEFYEGASVLRDDGRNVLQYGITEGNPELRRFLADWAAPRLGRRPEEDEIILTTGSQQIIDLAAWALIDKGDAVITEDPAYLAALSAFANHGAEFESVPADERGMRSELLPEIIEKVEKRGGRVKLIYTVPNFQNPSGACMSPERRAYLAEVSLKYSVPVLEDDPYGYLRYSGVHLPSVFSYSAGGTVIYGGSFSKILSPAVRIGWAVGDAEIIRRLTIFKQSTDICSSPITQRLALEYCERGYLDTHINKINDNYRIKRDAMQSSFERHLAPLGIKWTKPDGGFFFWLDFGDLDASELAAKCLEKNVAFIPGVPFSLDPSGISRFGRFNFSYSSPEVIEEGTLRVAETVKEILASKSSARAGA